MTDKKRDINEIVLHVATNFCFLRGVGDIYNGGRKAWGEKVKKKN